MKLSKNVSVENAQTSRARVNPFPRGNSDGDIYIYIRRPCLSQGRGGAWDHRRCGTFFLSQCFALSTSHPGHSTLCSPPRSHSGHSNFCPLPTGHSCSNLGFYGVPRRNRPRQTLCSSNKSLRPWQCPFTEVQGCRLPGFKTRQNSPNASLQLPGAAQAAVNLSCSSTSP